MNFEFTLRPVSPSVAAPLRQAAGLLLHWARQLLVAAAPLCSLYWVAGMPPRVSR